MSEISLFFGLGNPGTRYERTRHNIGGEALDSLAARHRLSWRKSRPSSRETRWRVRGRVVLLVRSLGYMNCSGEVLSPYGPLDPPALLVVCDDINLPLGQLRLRASGGSGGHRGLESIIDTLGSEDFPRLRLGVGSPEGGGGWSDYVLANFRAEERPAVEAMVESAVLALETVVREGLEEAMNRFNRRVAPPEPPGSRP